MTNEGRDSVPVLVDHLFRHEAARMTATLARILGPGRIDLVEDGVQEALLTALGHWPRDGIPANPTAWLIQVAKRRAVDVIRREQMVDEREDLVRGEIERWSERDAAASTDDPVLVDDQLRMTFTCCHPAIPAETRVTLTLKLAGGFGVSEIARAFLAEESAIHQRLVRAKRRIREAELAFEVPEGPELPERLDSVLDVLYAMFTEGHTAHAGDSLLRRDICEEAMRLGALVLRYPALERPAAHASHVAAGVRHLERAATGEELTIYHLRPSEPLGERYPGRAAAHCRGVQRVGACVGRAGEAQLVDEAEGRGREAAHRSQRIDGGARWAVRRGNGGHRGYFAIEAASYDEAVAITRGCPHLKYSGRIEVREVDLV